MLAGGVVQINLLVGRQVGSFFDGAIAWLSYSDRLYQLPLGVVGAAVAVVLLPELARRLPPFVTPVMLFVNEEGMPITEYLPEDHEGRQCYGLVPDPTPEKGRALRHKALPMAATDSTPASPSEPSV